MRNIKKIMLTAAMAICLTHGEAGPQEDESIKFGITVGAKGTLYRCLFPGIGNEIPVSIFGEYKFSDWFGMRASAVYSYASIKGFKPEEIDRGEGLNDILKKVKEVNKDSSSNEVSLLNTFKLHTCL